MRRWLLIACALSLGQPAPARADGAEFVRDRPFALTLRTGLLHTSDESFDVTWYRPAALGGSAWILHMPRRWLNGLQLYGMAGAEWASLAYREQPMFYQESLSGIHHADVDIDAGVTVGFGGRLSLYDDGRLHVSVFGDGARPLGPSDVTVHALLIDLDGLQVDVAKAVRENASVSFDGRTYRLGLTAGVSFRVSGLRWTPYLTAGWLKYRAEIVFETSDALKETLTAFGVDPGVLAEREIVETNVFLAPGVRLDLTRAWSLEAQALLGRYDGTWVAAGSAGIAWRFGP